MRLHDVRARLVALPSAVALLTAGMVGLAVHAGHSWLELRDLLLLRVEQGNLEGRIRWLDEVLTMSASMGAATGDPRWQARYDHYAPLLDAAIAGFIERATVDTELARGIYDANEELVALETTAFAAVRAGHNGDALQLLGSAAYQRWKVAYADSLGEFQRRAADALGQRIDHNQRELDRALVFLGLCTLASMATWLLLLLSLRGARERLSTQNGELAAVNDALAEVVRQKSQAMELVEASRRAKEEVLANMAHEIRTPLNGIVGAADLLRDASDPADARALVDTIATGGRTLAALVNDVLDLSKMEHGELALEQTALDLRRVASDAITLVSPLAEAKSLDLDLTVTAPVPARVLGDPVRLSQVLVNLLGNAIKFTDHGRVALEIGLVERVGSEVRLGFAVSDTGIGIAPDRQADVFEPYAQADGSTTRRFGGTGLGLTIVRHLITRMGSRITLASALGEGSTFRFELVLPLAEEQAAPTLALELAPTTGHALVADDNPVNVAIMRAMMTRLGWTTDVAHNGLEALELSRRGHYDMIFLDWRMPVMDGLEAARQMRAEEAERGRRVPILALTANASADDRASTRASGMDGHLSKPITRAALHSALLEWTGTRAAAA